MPQTTQTTQTTQTNQTTQTTQTPDHIPPQTAQTTQTTQSTPYYPRLPRLLHDRRESLAVDQNHESEFPWPLDPGPLNSLDTLDPSTSEALNPWTPSLDP